MSRAADLAVDCRHLTHRYGAFTAVNDFTLQVSAGETMGLLGPNGAGKTTVVRVLTTLTPVQRGQVNILGMDSRRNTMDIRYNIGYVPKQLSIESALTGRQNVELFARLAGRYLLRRHGPPAGTGSGAGEPAVTADPRRTDSGP